MQNFRATLVPATTVPVTIIGAFAAMAALGFTVNLSTLFGIVLAIGIVVDDAIVIVEGVTKYIERRMSGHDAAIRAMDELFGPIIGITLVLMAVFIPAAFVPGLTGNMFAQFALVIAATALISAVNAATLKPTQCALWLRTPVPPDERNIFYRSFNHIYDPMERGYAAFIGRMVRHSGLMVILALIVSAVGFYGLVQIPTSFIPIDDQGYLMIAAQLPEGAALGRTTATLEKAAAEALKVPGVDRVITLAGISLLDNSADLFNAGAAWVMLKPFDERLKAKDQDLLSIYERLAKGGQRSARRQVHRAAAARRSRASAMPAASRCRSSCSAARPTTRSWAISPTRSSTRRMRSRLCATCSRPSAPRRRTSP